MYHVVICTKEYLGPSGTRPASIFKKDEVYQAEDHGEEFRVWISNRGSRRASSLQVS